MAGNLTAMIASIFSGGVTADPYYEYTTLLLPGNGTNGAQNNTFLDGSTNNFTITRNGNTTQGTFSPFSQTGWGNYFNGSSYLSATSNAAFTLTGDFCVEFWVYSGLLAGGATNPTFINDSAGSNSSIFYETNGSNRGLCLYAAGAARITTATNVLVENQWNHVAILRSGTTGTNTAAFVNGTRVGTATAFTGTVDFSPPIINKYGPSAAGYLNGYMSNFRIVKGAPVYDPTLTTLTVPTAPLTAISGTSLLICQSNRFRDASTNNFAITLGGSPSVQAFSPFNPTASWSAATNGGSGYFDGSGDSLSVANNTALQLTGEFTMEAWYYPLGFPGGGLYDCLLTTGDNSLSNAIAIYINSSGGIQLYNHVTNAAIFNTASGVVLNAWNHIAATRNSSNGVDLWLNGVSQGSTVTVSSSFTSTTPTRIGTSSTNQDCYGYISTTRIVKGAAVYTGAFTPPIAPLSTSGSASASAYPSTTNVNTSFASSATSLLLNFTNAGIYDATSKNDLETVGNAQISTTQSKWGGSSMYFDGTGDWLLIPDQPPQRIGTGNFTVEMWVYRNSSGTYGLAGKGTGTTGWLVSLNSSNQVVFTYGSSTITSSGTVSATTWTHIAVVREGTSTNQTKIYISGTNDGTGTVSTDFNQTNSMYIGADRTGGSAANAYVQDVRITNYARYTGNFTPPTAAFPTL